MWRWFMKESILVFFLQIKTKHASLKSNKVTVSTLWLMAGTVIGIKQAAARADFFHYSEVIPLFHFFPFSLFLSEPLNISAFSQLPPTSAAFHTSWHFEGTNRLLMYSAKVVCMWCRWARRKNAPWEECRVGVKGLWGRATFTAFTSSSDCLSHSFAHQLLF